MSIPHPAITLPAIEPNQQNLKHLTANQTSDPGHKLQQTNPPLKPLNVHIAGRIVLDGKSN
jgi:hypothetical protein